MDYRIACSQKHWQLTIEGQEVPLLQSEERAFLVQIACKVAAHRDTAVDVYNEGNELEARIAFKNGVVAIQGSYVGHLDLTLGPEAAVPNPHSVPSS